MLHTRSTLSSCMSLPSAVHIPIVDVFMVTLQLGFDKSKSVNVVRHSVHHVHVLSSLAPCHLVQTCVVFFRICRDHDHHSSLGISWSICPESVVELGQWDFSTVEFLSPVLSTQTCGTHADISPPCVRTVCVTSCSVHTCCVGSRGLVFFRAVPAGLVKILLVLLGLQGALSVVFLCRLAQNSFQLVVADYSLHVLHTRVLACFRVQDASSVLVDNR